MNDQRVFSRRATLMSMGAFGAGGLLGAGPGAMGPASARAAAPGGEPRRVRREIADVVRRTSFVDTHEHLPEEDVRLAGNMAPCVPPADDWSVLLSPGYLGADLVAAGMPLKTREKFFARDVDPLEKWSLVEPFWPAVKNTGYGLADRITIRELYGVEELSAKTIGKVQAGYEKTRVKGFYRRILRDVANVESCQVNSFERPFVESAQPMLLMQDISTLGMVMLDPLPDLPGWSPEAHRTPTGIEVQSLSDWQRVIDWWFDKYGRYAVAVKAVNAYSRDIDFDGTLPSKAEGLFKKHLAKTPLSDGERKALEDYLFWYAVQKATQHNLPVRIHTGYYAGENEMPLARVRNNAGSACELCRAAPDTRFVFMHICWPYYEELIAVAKQYSNAYIDMCWAWILNPIAAKDFLKKYLVTAPANKVFSFGADHVCVENVVGHAALARRGIAQALDELVEEGWLSLGDALGLVEPIMRGNARRVFNLEEKERVLKAAPWAKGK